MTPKEKAEELVNKMIIDFSIDKWQSKRCAKECALIAVDEIIHLPSVNFSDFWQEVKQEIENL